jgi:hypothetical protein
MGRCGRASLILALLLLSTPGWTQAEPRLLFSLGKQEAASGVGIAVGIGVRAGGWKQLDLLPMLGLGLAGDPNAALGLAVIDRASGFGLCLFYAGGRHGNPGWGAGLTFDLTLLAQKLNGKKKKNGAPRP